MQETSIKVLLIEDDEDDYVMVRDLLRDVEGTTYEVEWISDFDAGLRAACHAAGDVCLVDYRLGARDGIEFLESAAARHCSIPTILLTGQGDHEVDMAAMRAGAADFLNKAQLSADLLERVIRYSIQHKRSEAQRIEFIREQAARREAEAASRAKDQFLAMLAHELRNPLAAIDGAMRLVKEPGSEEHRVWAIEVAERQVGHLVRLIDDLLDVSRITQGKIQLDLRPLDLAEVVQRAVEAVRPMIDTLGHELTVEPPSQPLKIEADATRLQQVVVNLLTNAAKYTDAGGRITLHAGREDGSAVIRVRDTGIGMKPDLLARVFDLFAQADDSLDRSQGGLGIGLTLVRRLVEMHGGSVEAHSAGPGHGSEFVVRLPALHEALARPATPQPADAQPESLRRRVLVVDDNKDAARMLATLLRIAGHEVKVAYNGPDALRVAQDFAPSFVLLDIGLPRMNGYEVAVRMRQTPGLDAACLVALTGYGQDEDRRRSAEAGFDHHLVKPVDHATLMRMLAEECQAANGNGASH